MKFIRGSQVGFLKIQLVEVNYKFVNRLTFVDKFNSFLYSETWRSNAHKKAQKEIESLGYKEANN